MNGTRFDAFLLLCEPPNGWRDEAEARAAFLAFERDRLVAAGAEPARLDAEGTAEARTRILGHGRAGDCHGPGITRADSIEDTRTGERTPLRYPDRPIPPAAALDERAVHDALSRFEARVSDDTVKRDPELVCSRCDEVLCDIEHGDTLDVLVGVATDHRCGETGEDDDRC